MRLTLLAAALVFAGCVPQNTDPGPGPGPGGWGTGPGGTGGDTSFGCQKDLDCGGDVCARDGTCEPASLVETVHVTWTLSGKVAGTQTCSTAPGLDITFFDGQTSGQFGFSPVPCAEGKFTVDRLPIHYHSVELSRAGDNGTGGTSGVFGTDGTVVLDLPY